MMNHWKF